MNLSLPMTGNIRHFGKGQAETEITLLPGRHILQLLVSDKSHVPLESTVESERITTTIK